LPDLFTQEIIQQQRTANTLTPEQIQRINAGQAPITQKLTEMYSGLLEEGKSQLGQYGQVSPDTLQKIQQNRETAGLFGITPTGEQQVAEYELKQAYAKSVIDKME